MLVFAAVVLMLAVTIWAAGVLRLVAFGMDRVVEQERYDREFHRIVEQLGALDPEGE
jgi:hypothetical protein